MSDNLIPVWITLLFTSLIVFGYCAPISEESTPNRYDGKEEISTTEGILAGEMIEDNASEKWSSINVDDRGPSTQTATIEVKENGKEVKRDINEDSDEDSDDDSDEDDEEMVEEEEGRRRDAFRFFKLLDGRSKRSAEGDNSDGSIAKTEEASPKEKSTEEIMEAESFLLHDMYDYSLDRKKREYVPKLKPSTKLNKEREPLKRDKRQSGETVPYMPPIISRREIPVPRESLLAADEERRETETEEATPEEVKEEKEEEEGRNVKNGGSPEEKQTC